MEDVRKNGGVMYPSFVLVPRHSKELVQRNGMAWNASQLVPTLDEVVYLVRRYVAFAI